jgi:membrane associated rhomboid family serine protease
VSAIALLHKPVQRALLLHPYRIRKDGQIYRLLTAGWVHADGTHLLFNMLTLYFFADDVMKVLGAARFLVLYSASVIVGFLPSTLRYMKKSDYGSLGASGAVAAVMFSAILLYPGLKLHLMFIPIPVPGLLFALLYLAYSAWHSYSAGDNINHDAHFSGAASGAIITYLFEPGRVERTLKQLL